MDNAVWERILQRESKDPIKAELRHRIESDFILPNHADTCKLIENGVYLAAPDNKVMEASMKYLRHVAVYRALRASGNTKVDPLDVGEEWPADVFPSIERKAARIRGIAETTCFLKPLNKCESLIVPAQLIPRLPVPACIHRRCYVSD